MRRFVLAIVLIVTATVDVTIKKKRVALERMMIRAFASVLKNKRGVPTMAVSNYRLANDKIDV